MHGLARAQVRAGHDVCVAALHPEAGGEAVHEGVRYRRLRRVGASRYPFARGLGPLLHEADVVHVHGLDGLADQVVRRHRAVGVSTHGGYFHTPRHRWLKALALRTITRRTLRRAGAVWFTSQADQRALAAAGVEGAVIGDGIDLAELSSVARHPIGGRWVVPGRVDVHKGLDDLAWWVAALGPVGPAEVRVVGPWTRPDLVPRLRRAGMVLTGPLSRERWLEEVACAERVVLPSRFEGFGITAVEVMAMRVPLVLTPIAAHRELDPCPPKAGQIDLLARPSPAEARRRWRRLDPEALVDRRAVAVEKHGWDRVAARFADAYAALEAR